MIILLCPTVRPEQMKITLDHWYATSSGTVDIHAKVAVVHPEHIAPLAPYDTLLVETTRRGATTPLYALTKDLEANKDDIIIVPQDDMFSPNGWDLWLLNQLNNKSAVVFVNDGYMMQDCMPLPIMTYDCLLKLNKIIYHPSYIHQYADNELYHNTKELGMLIDLRQNSPIFEHRHWVNNHRKSDEHDAFIASVASQDATNWSKRKQMTIEERLVV